VILQALLVKAREELNTAMNGKALGASAKLATFSAIAAGVAATAKSIVDIAVKLA
jgi:hypothetical protein